MERRKAAFFILVSFWFFMKSKISEKDFSLTNNPLIIQILRKIHKSIQLVN